MVHGKLFFFAAFLFKAEQKPVPGRIIVFDLQVHDGADPGESVGKDPEQSAIAEAGVRGCLDSAQKLLNFTFDKRRRFAFGPRKSLGLDFPGRIHGEHSFFGEPGKQHPDRRHVLFDRGRRGLALKDFDILEKEPQSPLFPAALGKTGKLSRRPLVRTDAADMLKRRLKQAGLPAHYSPHSFRATGITNFLENDGTLEAAQRIAGHADSRTTKLYDRRGQKVLLEDMERIRY